MIQLKKSQHKNKKTTQQFHITNQLQYNKNNRKKKQQNIKMLRIQNM